MGHQRRKLKAPSAKDQAVGVSDQGPHETNYEEELIWSIHSAAILAITKLEIMQHAVQEVLKCTLVPTGSKLHPCWVWAVM